MRKKDKPKRPEIRNRKAWHDYTVLERLETGVALWGTEVKSLRAGGGQIDEAFARIEGDELFLYSCHIDTYSCGSTRNHDPKRKRKLLAHRREIKKLTVKVTQRGLTLVPLSIYFNDRGLAKVDLALVRGKSHSDKRQDLKKRDHEREMSRAMRWRTRG
jgi:SsrA-binding protein